MIDGVCVSLVFLRTCVCVCIFFSVHVYLCACVCRITSSRCRLMEMPTISRWRDVQYMCA